MMLCLLLKSSLVLVCCWLLPSNNKCNHASYAHTAMLVWQFFSPRILLNACFWRKKEATKPRTRKLPINNELRSRSFTNWVPFPIPLFLATLLHWAHLIFITLLSKNDLMEKLPILYLHYRHYKASEPVRNKFWLVARNGHFWP